MSSQGRGRSPSDPLPIANAVPLGLCASLFSSLSFLSLSHFLSNCVCFVYPGCLKHADTDSVAPYRFLPTPLETDTHILFFFSACLLFLLELFLLELFLRLKRPFCHFLHLVSLTYIFSPSPLKMCTKCVHQRERRCILVVCLCTSTLACKIRTSPPPAFPAT